MPKIVAFVFSVFLFLVVTKSAYAVTLTISDYPQIISNVPFTTALSVQGAQAGTNYLRVDLYKEGTTKYFGETYNGTDWYSGSNGKEYFPVSIQSGQTWTGNVQAKVGEPSSSDYPEPGLYKMRIRRYTTSGNQGGEDANVSAVSVNIDIPAPSPTPTPVSDQAQPSSSTSNPKSPSPVPKSTTTSVSNNRAVTATPSPRVLSQSTSYSPSASPVLELARSPSPTASPAVDLSQNTPKFAGILVVSGAFLIAASSGLYLLYRKKYLSKKSESENNQF